MISEPEGHTWKFSTNTSTNQCSKCNVMILEWGSGDTQQWIWVNSYSNLINRKEWNDTAVPTCDEALMDGALS